MRDSAFNTIRNNRRDSLLLGWIKPLEELEEGYLFGGKVILWIAHSSGSKVSTG